MTISKNADGDNYKASKAEEASGMRDLHKQRNFSRFQQPGATPHDIDMWGEWKGQSYPIHFRGIRDPKGRVKGWRVEIRPSLSTTKIWVGTFSTREKAKRAYDVALHITGKDTYYYTYPADYFPERRGNGQTKFVKDMAKTYAEKTDKLLVNPASLILGGASKQEGTDAVDCAPCSKVGSNTDHLKVARLHSPDPEESTFAHYFPVDMGGGGYALDEFPFSSPKEELTDVGVTVMEANPSTPWIVELEEVQDAGVHENLKYCTPDSPIISEDEHWTGFLDRNPTPGDSDQLVLEVSESTWEEDYSDVGYKWESCLLQSLDIDEFLKDAPPVQKVYSPVQVPDYNPSPYPMHDAKRKRFTGVPGCEPCSWSAGAIVSNRVGSKYIPSSASSLEAVKSYLSVDCWLTNVDHGPRIPDS